MYEDDFGRFVNGAELAQYRSLGLRGLRYRNSWFTAVKRPQGTPLPWELSPFNCVTVRNGYNGQIRTSQPKPVSRSNDQRLTIGLFHIEYYGQYVEEIF